MTKRAFVPLLFVLGLLVAGLNVPLAQNRPATANDIPKLQFEKYSCQRPRGDHEPGSRLPMVAVNLWYHVGPANEEPGAPASRTCSST
jgi:zinc protease